MFSLDTHTPTRYNTPTDSGNTPKNIGAIMNLQNIVRTVLFSLLVSVSTEAMARPDLTPEELAKAQEIASQMNPPVDINTLLDEAERLGVECKGNLTLRPMIKACSNKVETAQMDEDIQASKVRVVASQERQAKQEIEIARLQAENGRLDEEYKAMGQEIKETLDEAKQIAGEKLSQQ